MKKLYSIPKELKQTKYWVEAYSLLPRKHKFVHGNIELRYGMNYYIWGRYSRCYYKREIRRENSTKALIESILRGIVYLNPTQEQKELIQAEMESNGMGYYQLQRFRFTEFQLDRHIRLGDKTFGYLQKKHKLETLLIKIRNNEQI